jgi:hypothetical protein
MDGPPSNAAQKALVKLAQVIASADGRRNLVNDMQGAMGDEYNDLPEGTRAVLLLFNEEQLRLVHRVNERFMEDGFSHETEFGRVCFF